MPKVFTAQNPTEAHFVMGLLQAEGLDAEVRKESLFTTVGGAGALVGMLPEVWALNPDQITQARAIVDRYASGKINASPAMPPWTCAQCGESHEPQFTSCWKCGAVKAD